MLVHLASPPDPEQRRALEQEGVSLLRPLGGGAWFARVNNPRKLAPKAAGMGLAGAAEIRTEWKLHPRLARGEIPDSLRMRMPAKPGPGQKGQGAAAAPAGEVEYTVVYVAFHPDVPEQPEAFALVQRHGGKLVSWVRTIHTGVVWVPISEITALAGEDAVQWIEPALPPLQPLNDSSRSVSQVDLVQAAPYGLSGAGINVMIYDGGAIIPGHPDFGSRVVLRDSSAPSDHATHVAGIVGADGTVSLEQGRKYRGMAPAAFMQSYGFETGGVLQPGFLYTEPGDIEADYLEAVQSYGAMVTNNSIGSNVAVNMFDCGWEGDYGLTSALIDALACGQAGTEMRIIWAAGNERQPPGYCGQTYGTLAPPASAKNHICVGAINSNDESMTEFSSWGPTDDGRLKPDIVAPGCQVGGDGGITSTNDSGGYYAQCGTSMASPAVTGICALLLEDWLVQFPGRSLPHNSTLKALLVHTAADLGNAGPDYRFGYGAVRARRAVDFLRNRSFEEGSVVHGEELVYYVYVAAGTGTMKATLAWDDYPAPGNALGDLVNDLDLVVTSPDGVQTRYPWTLDPANPEVPASRAGPDHTNNVEQVLVESPLAGTWTIRVRGTDVPAGPQTFSLATTPNMQVCSNSGFIVLSTDRCSCTANVMVTLNDCDLDLNHSAVDIATVTVSSTSDPQGEPLILTETTANSATFEGSITVSPTGEGPAVRVSTGDTLTATYLDAADSMGSPQTATDTATVDCLGPAISGVTVTNLTALSATINFTTSEPARTTVRYGLSCADLNKSTNNGGTLATVHKIQLTRLMRNSPYAFSVEAEDAAGNKVISNNGGNCYSFATLSIRDYFTEDFTTSSDNDLDNQTIQITPAGGTGYYMGCTNTIHALPTDTSGATYLHRPDAGLMLGDDDFVRVPLADGKRFPFFGAEYDAVFVCTNGHVDFVEGNAEYNETLETHFSAKRISVLFDDLTPDVASSISYKQLPDRLVITWENMPEFNLFDSNTFQLELSFDGSVRMSWLRIDATDGLVGLSEGLGLPSDYVESDLTDYLGCLLALRARMPSPPDGASGVNPNAQVTWIAGAGAVSHDLYFGMDPLNLEYQGTATYTFFDPGQMEIAARYYWRVDEVNANGVTVGDVWTFEVDRVSADFDRDGDVDQQDFAHLQLCLSGPDTPQGEESCADTRLDADSDVDQDDVNKFYRCLSGPNIAVNLGCD